MKLKLLPFSVLMTGMLATAVVAQQNQLNIVTSFNTNSDVDDAVVLIPEPYKTGAQVALAIYGAYAGQQKENADQLRYKQLMRKLDQMADHIIITLSNKMDYVLSEIIERIDESDLNEAHNTISQFISNYESYRESVSGPYPSLEHQKYYMDVLKSSEGKLSVAISRYYELIKRSSSVNERLVIPTFLDILAMVHSYQLDKNRYLLDFEPDLLPRLPSSLARSVAQDNEQYKKSQLAYYVAESMITFMTAKTFAGTDVPTIISRIIRSLPNISTQLAKGYTRKPEVWNPDFRSYIFRDDSDISYLPIVNREDVTSDKRHNVFVPFGRDMCVYSHSYAYHNGKAIGYNVAKQHNIHMEYDVKGARFTKYMGDSGYRLTDNRRGCDLLYRGDNFHAFNEFFTKKVSMNNTPELVMPVYIKQLNEVYRPLEDVLDSLDSYFSFMYGAKDCKFNASSCASLMSKYKHLKPILDMRHDTSIASVYDAITYAPEITFSVTVGDDGVPTGSWSLLGSEVYDYSPICKMYRNNKYVATVPTEQVDGWIGALNKNEEVHLTCDVSFNIKSQNGPSYKHNLTLNSAIYRHTHEGAQDEVKGDILDVNVKDNVFNGNTITDTSGNGFVGVFDAPVQLTQSRFGRPNEALHFNGRNRLIFNDFRSYLFDEDFSVSLWAKRTGGYDNYAGLINTGYATTGRWEIRMGSENNGQTIGAGIVSMNDPSVWDQSNLTMPNNQWNHIVLTYDGSNVRFFINGVEQFGRDQQGIPDSGLTIYKDKPLIIGQAGWGSDGGTEYFVGDIDDIKLIDHALSQNEVHGLYYQKDSRN